MHVNFVGSKEFEQACREAVGFMLWASGEEYDEFSVEDCADTTLQFVAGEVFALGCKLQSMGLMPLHKDSLSALATGMMGQIVGSGVSVLDNDVWGVSSEERHLLYEWVRKRHFHNPDLYVGDDGIVYILGKEGGKQIALRMSLSEGVGRFGAMFDFSYDGMATVDAAALRAAREVHLAGWAKTWVKGYEEVPA